MFEEIIKNHYQLGNKINDPISTIAIYPVNSGNLEGLKILLDTCKAWNLENNNVRIATVDPTLWIGKFLDKHFDKISYVTQLPNFEISQIIDGRILLKTFSANSINFETEAEMDKWFEENKWKTLVIHSLKKQVNLETLKTSFSIRYADISDKQSQRDKKLNNILE